MFSETISTHEAFRRRPIDGLPLELLHEIFFFFVADRRVGGTRSRHMIQMAPVILCHVCALWRNEALNMPALWKRVTNPVNGGWIPDDLDMVQFWLERAERAKLKVSIFQRVYCIVRTPLLSSIARWRTLRLILDDDYAETWRFVELLLDIPLCESLEKLTIESCYPRNPSGSMGNFVDYFKDLPSLWSLKWYPEFVPELLSTPWPGLRRILLGEAIQLDTYLSLLSGLPNIEDIDIKCSFNPSDPKSVVMDEIIELPKLRKLRIVCNTGIGQFLRYLTLPSLQDLSILVHSSWNDDYAHLGGLMSRSDFKLQTLHWEHLGQFTNENEFIMCLTSPCLSTVTKLLLRTEDMSEDVVHSLTYPTTIFPVLTKLVLVGCSAPDGAISKMVSSRRKRQDVGLTVLESARLIFQLDEKELSTGYPIDDANFRSMQAEGFSGLDWDIWPKTSPQIPDPDDLFLSPACLSVDLSFR